MKTTTKTRTPRHKPKAKRQTSDRVSSAAARLMAKRRKGFRFYMADGKEPWFEVTMVVEAICGSVLAQDEVRGMRKGGRR